MAIFEHRRRHSSNEGSSMTRHDRSGDTRDQATGLHGTTEFEATAVISGLFGF
jgi:hypothetical protein